MTRNQKVANVVARVLTSSGITVGWSVGYAVGRFRATQPERKPSRPCVTDSVAVIVTTDEADETAMLMACEALLNMIRQTETAKALVLSMALGIERTHLPDDERELLDAILEDRP